MKHKKMRLGQNLVHGSTVYEILKGFKKGFEIRAFTLKKEVVAFIQ